MPRTELTGSQIKDQSVSLTADVTGTLPVANGGTGSTTLALNNALLGNGTGALQAVAPGTAGNVLTSDGSTWVSQSGTVTLTGTQTLTNKTLQSPAGSASAPTYSFSGDTDTGIYSSSADTLAISTGGSVRLYVRDSGHSVAGAPLITRPQDMVNGVALVSSGGSQIPSLSVSRSNAGGNPVIAQFNSDGTPDAPELLIAGRSMGRNNWYGYDGTQYVQGAAISAVVDSTPSVGVMPGRIGFFVNDGTSTTPAERMRLTSTGSVGIGTTSPAAKLDVAGEIRGTTINANGVPVVTTTDTQTLSNKTFSGATAFGTIELGNADTTLERTAAGVVAVEGVNLESTGNKNATNGYAGLSAGKVAVAQIPSTPVTAGHHWWPSQYVSGQYYFTQSQQDWSTSTLNNGTVRVTPWIVASDVTITRLFMEFTNATVGDANSVFRIGIWNHDPTTGRPSTLVLDAGTISTGSGNAGDVATGGVAGVYEITVSLALTAGAYWIGGALQGVTTTQPTFRTFRMMSHPLYPLGSTLPTGAVFRGFTRTGITSSFDQYTWNSSTTWGISGGDCARIGFKVS